MAVGEWDQRQLCPDGACVGVIGPDGTCKVCGRAAPNWGDERNRGLIDPPDEEADEPEDDDDDDDDDEDYDDGDAAGTDDAYDEDDDVDEDDQDDDEAEDDGDATDQPGLAAAPPAAWGTRQLCSDGSCIGVIGADGRCKVCGRTAAGAVEPAPASAEPAKPTSSDPDGNNTDVN